MTSLVESPLELLRTIAGSVRALASLPASRERTLRDESTE